MPHLHRPWVLALGLFLCQCTINEVGPPGQDGGFDRQLRLPLGTALITTPSQDTVFADGQFDLIRFDKRNYLEVDSIVFVSRMRAQVDEDTCRVLLYNHTDNTFINNVVLERDTTTFEWVSSGNIFSALPNREIDLNVVLVSKKNGAIVEGGQSYLFLYRESN
ncbi:MAG: hypothetical protein OHK0053_05190 [Microscillaceae bacterium]